MFQALPASLVDATAAPVAVAPDSTQVVAVVQLSPETAVSSPGSGNTDHVAPEVVLVKKMPEAPEPRGGAAAKHTLVAATQLRADTPEVPRGSCRFEKGAAELVAEMRTPARLGSCTPAGFGPAARQAVALSQLSADGAASTPPMTVLACHDAPAS
jgi:hypothetical protein